MILTSCLKKEDYHLDISYEGEQLRYISVPLGGIGTGNLLLNGYGAIRDIEIFNRPSMDDLPPYMTFFSLYTKEEGEEPVAKILEGEYLDEFPNPFGKPRQQLGGLPRFQDVVFHNAYPMVRIDLADESVPLDVRMEAWSPYIPLDTERSSLPAAVIEWKLTNTGEEPVDYSISFSMGNPMSGYGPDGRKSSDGCSVMPYDSKNWKGVTFTSPVEDSTKPDMGSFRVLFPGEGTISTGLPGGGWWDDAHLFWNDFSSAGILKSRIDTVVQSGSKETVAGMSLSGKLEPGESKTIPFLFSWHIPVRALEGNMAFDNDAVRGVTESNYYSRIYRSIDDVTNSLTAELELLRSKTFNFSEAMITSSVPVPVLDAAISNMASLKTNLLMQNEDGDLHGYEGLGNDFGCCAGNCTHVWNYAQTMAVLFPSLERNVRETGFRHSTFENGYQCFRTVFPLSDNWFKNVAADGQMGNIIRAYREWKISGDNEWLGEIWPGVRSALEFAWKGPGELVEKYPWMNNCPVPWDPYKEGVIRGDQHNTYDINFYGPNMMTGSLYLGALKASSEMAMAMNEPERSMEYKQLYESGRKKYLELLWNGEYFIQQVELIEGVTIPGRLESPPDKAGNVMPKYQFGEGCLSDQLLGQYLSFVSGLGYLMDTAVTRTTLESIYRYNFRSEMRDFDNVQRIYAANGEPGLVTCTWPNGNKPVLPFVYSDEVWTGIEYQVATSMIFTGLIDEGLTIAESVRKRYNGSNRNPFGEIESGRYYARALASWGVYQAMAGYHWDGRKNKMRFSPAEDVLPIRFFWATGSAWGTIEVSRANIKLHCLHGELILNDLEFYGKSFFVLREFEPSHNVEVDYRNETLMLSFPGKLSLKEDEIFTMVLP